MKNIRNIIFDLGGVVIDIEEKRTHMALAELIGEKKLKQIESSFFHEFEKGERSIESFINRFQLMVEYDINPDQIMNAWNAMLIDIPDNRIRVMNEINSNYNLFVLSNTNAIHLLWVQSFLAQHHDITSENWGCFDKVYYSHKIHHRKPELLSFKHILADQNLIPKETLLIDDKIVNIQAAEGLGIQAGHKPADVELIEYLKQLGLYKPL